MCSFRHTFSVLWNKYITFVFFHRNPQWRNPSRLRPSSPRTPLCLTNQAQLIYCSVELFVCRLLINQSNLIKVLRIKYNHSAIILSCSESLIRSVHLTSIGALLSKVDTLQGRYFPDKKGDNSTEKSAFGTTGQR